jgi:glutamate synthase domain-containing protein 1
MLNRGLKMCIIFSLTGCKRLRRRRLGLRWEDERVCGIIGYLEKRSQAVHPLGQTLLCMLQALSCRGPDSAGVAVFGPARGFWIVQVKLPETGERAAAAQAILAALQGQAEVIQQRMVGAYLRLELEGMDDPLALETSVLSRVPHAEVVSLGHQLEIVKQVGSPDRLEQDYGIAQWVGSHGIGHTRLSTESRVDLSHSQPFWAHGVPDLATVHNGHITNYHKLRRSYEQKGYRFFTENDSEVIGIYLRERLREGLPLADALRASLDDFDGSFTYLAAGGDCLAYVRDRFGFKPLMVAETDEFVALATEEIALRQALGHDFVAREPAPGNMMVWSVPAVAGAFARSGPVSKGA